MSIPLPLFTLIHVMLSVAGILAGLVVVGGLMSGVQLRRWTGFFLLTTVLTNVTGFGFPFAQILPSHIVGALSLVMLVIALFALYAKQQVGAWRPMYVVSSIAALYLNVFVLLAQLFQKTPAIARIAPDPSAPGFAICQLLVLALFVALGWIAVRRFRGVPIPLN